MANGAVGHLTEAAPSLPNSQKHPSSPPASPCLQVALVHGPPQRAQRGALGGVRRAVLVHHPQHGLDVTHGLVRQVDGGLLQEAAGAKGEVQREACQLDVSGLCLVRRPRQVCALHSTAQAAASLVALEHEARGDDGRARDEGCPHRGGTLVHVVGLRSGQDQRAPSVASAPAARQSRAAHCLPRSSSTASPGAHGVGKGGHDGEAGVQDLVVLLPRCFN